MTDAAEHAGGSDLIRRGQVMAEIEEEARRDGARRATCRWPANASSTSSSWPTRPVSGGGGDLAEALERVDRAIFVDPVVPIDSNRKAGAAVKKGMRSLSLWYVGWLTHQINQFASATSRSLHIIERRLDELERKVAVQRVPYAGVVEFPALQRTGRLVGRSGRGGRDRPGGRPGRTLHAACGDGWLVRRIGDRRRGRVRRRPAPGRAGGAEGTSGASDLRADDVATTCGPWPRARWVRSS